MDRNMELQQWKEDIKGFFEWNVSLIEHTQKIREKGYNIFAHDVPISIGALELKLEDLKNLSTPKYKECKKTKKSLEESMKHRIKGLQLELKHFQDIQAETLAGRFGAGAVSMATTKAGDMLRESLATFHSMFQE